MSVLVELPGWYVDELILEDPGATYFVILNRSPEPGEVEVGVEDSISFDIGTDAADTPTPVTLQVYLSVDGGPEVLAYDGTAGGFQPGYTGPDSTASFFDAKTVRVVVDPLAEFDSLQMVTVRVVAESTGGQTLESSWSFTVQDITPPRLETAKARELLVVRLTFDEPVNMEAATETGSALNPDNYAFTPVSVPAVSVEAVSVEEVTSNVVDVTLDIEATQGATYLVTVTNVEDLLGNVIEAPYNTATFAGFTCPVPDGRSFDLYQMLSQKTRDNDPGDLEDFVACLQEVTDLLLCEIDRWTDILDPDLAPEVFLDAMLQDLGNPFADFDLDAIDKRRLIRVLVQAYKQKGTGVGIINLIRFFLGVEVTINSIGTEGWILGVDELGETTILGPGTSFALYAFEIVSPVVLTAAERERIGIIAEYMKPAHTHYVQLTEPETPTVIDHLELGLSELGVTWTLH